MEVQKLNIEIEDQFACAYKYYQIISVLNELNLAHGQLQLIAFTAIRGNISNPAYRKEYCIRYDTTSASINNVVNKMKKSRVMIKKNKVIFVNPALTKIDFTQPIQLIIDLMLIPQRKPIVEETRESMELKNDSVLNVVKHG